MNFSKYSRILHRSSSRGYFLNFLVVFVLGCSLSHSHDLLWELMDSGILRLSQTLWPQEFGQAFGGSCMFSFSLFPHHPFWQGLWYLNEPKSWLICSTVTVLQCGFPDSSIVLSSGSCRSSHNHRIGREPIGHWMLESPLQNHCQVII